jgi:hypothetical protein
MNNSYFNQKPDFSHADSRMSEKTPRSQSLKMAQIFLPVKVNKWFAFETPWPMTPLEAV